MSSPTSLSVRVKAPSLQILDRRHVGDDAAAFHHLKDAAADDLVGIDAVDARAVEQDFAADDFAVLGLEQARDRLQRRRLAGAVGAEQRHDRALGHLEAEAAQHQDDLVVDHLDVADAEQRGGGWRRAVRDDRFRLLRSCVTCIRLCSSSPAKAGDPVFQRRLRSTERPRRTGSPAFAGMTTSAETPAGESRHYQPSHSGLRGRSMVFTFSSLMVPFLTRSLSGASVAPATFMR